MKKILFTLLLVLLIVATLIPISVSAQETSTLSINCVAGHSEAKGRKLVATLRNTETGEEIKKVLSTKWQNEFLGFPIGEYEIVKCALYADESIEIEVVTKKSFVVTQEYSVFSFRVADHFNKEYHGPKDDYKEVSMPKLVDLLYATLALSIVVMFFVWLVIAIQGRKNYHKKMIANFVMHLLLTIVGFALALSLTNADPSKWYIWILGACFPCGVFWYLHLSMRGGSDDLNHDAEHNGGGGSVLLFAFIFAALLGVIALPTVLVTDIIKIHKTKNDIYI